MAMPTRPYDPTAPVYLRIGDWDPRHPFSRNYARGTIEAGLSVYDLDARRMPITPTEGEWAAYDLRDRLASDEPKYLVQGLLTGEDHDGEPLLADPFVVGDWEPRR